MHEKAFIDSSYEKKLLKKKKLYLKKYTRAELREWFFVKF